MWEAMGEVFTSGNGVAIGILITIIIVGSIVGVKHGRLKIKTDKFTIEGKARGNERLVVRMQLDWLYNAVFAFEQKIPMPEDYNEFRGRYILAMLYIDMAEWVLYNHIEETKHYVEIKQSDVWNKAQTMVEKDELKSAKFKAVVDNYVKDIIHNLVMIRKEYEK
jgi:hypothetical protein